MATSAAIQGLVEARVDDLTSEYNAWPKNMLRLHLECLEKKRKSNTTVGIYQDKTGSLLEGLKRAGEVTEFQVNINGKEHSFISEPENTTVSQEVKERYERVDKFLEASGHFGSLIAYVTLCKVWEELDNAHVDVFPEGSYEVLHHVERKPDSFIIYPNEYIPVEVYNGRDYLDTPSENYESEKYEQMYDYATIPPGEKINCHPFLINRRSTDDLQGRLRQWNGMVIDTDCIMACDQRKPAIEDDLEFFEIKESVEFVPKIEASDGTKIDGEKYDNAKSNSPLLRPRAVIAENGNKIPDFYMERVRGGVQLHYVNSYYRRRHDVTSHQACRIVQELYNQLLRHGGKERDTAISDAWNGVKFGDAMDSQQKLNITDTVNGIIDGLIGQRIIYRQGSNIYARRAEHPQQDLTFSL